MPQRFIKRNNRKTTASVQSQAREAERLLSSIREQIRRPVNAMFATASLTGPQRSVMQVLVTSTKPLSVKELRQELGLAQSTVSGIVDRLVQQGMMVRTTDPGDRRSVLLQPSEQVRKFLNTQVAELSATPLAVALENTTQSRRGEILSALRLLQVLLKHHED